MWDVSASYVRCYYVMWNVNDFSEIYARWRKKIISASYVRCYYVMWNVMWDVSAIYTHTQYPIPTDTHTHTHTHTHTWCVCVYIHIYNTVVFSFFPLKSPLEIKRKGKKHSREKEIQLYKKQRSPKRTCAQRLCRAGGRAPSARVCVRSPARGARARAACWL